MNNLIVKTETPVENPYTDDVFENVKKESCTLTVPAGSKQAYLASRTWKNFKIVEAVSDAAESVYSEKTTVKNDGTTL